MNSTLQYFNYRDHTLSNCGEVLDIELSSKELDWSGVILEKGRSPHFYPDNVYTPYFYFALALEQDLNWQASTQQGVANLKTSPGDIWINPPQTPFSHNIDEPCYFVILAVEKSRFLQASSLNIAGKDLQFLNNYNVDDPTIKGIIDLFILEVQTDGKNGTSYLDNLLSLLTTHYLHNYSNYNDLVRQQDLASKFDATHIARIERYVEQRIGQPIGIEELSQLLGCSKFYFLREFKKLQGVTPYQYIVSMRLQRAKQGLLEGAQLADIAINTGFTDQSHFTRVFKKEFGLTPGQFKKQQ